MQSTYSFSSPIRMGCHRLWGSHTLASMLERKRGAEEAWHPTSFARRKSYPTNVDSRSILLVLQEKATETHCLLAGKQPIHHGPSLQPPYGTPRATGIQNIDEMHTVRTTW